MKKRRNKRNGILMIGLFAVLLTLVGCGSKLPEVSFPEKVAKLESYVVTGKLTSIFPSGTKECHITASYQKPDLYRVEIDNSTSGDKQILIKNTDGVHVLIPSINKSFKIKSGWPINSSYPYLLQSLAKDIIADESPVITKNENSTTIETEIKMFENAMPSCQKIIFNNKTNLPEEVLIYDDNQTLISRFVFTKIDLDCTIDKELFSPKLTISSMREIYDDIDVVRTIAYPTYFPLNSSLTDEKIKGTSANKSAIMQFGGACHYTIIQEFCQDNTDIVTVYAEGDIVVFGGIAYIVTENVVNFYYSGVEYCIASTELNALEMIKIGDSLIIDIEK